MKFSPFASAAAAAVCCLLISGCGDTFRPVASPLPQPSPDPQSFRLAVFTSAAPGTQGAATDVDVSGDSVAAVSPVGTNPVFALVESTRVVVADKDSDSITSYTHLDLTTTVTFGTPGTTALPAGAAPVSLADANGNIYIAESGRGVVGVLAGSPLALSTEIPVGANPVNVVALANAAKAYAVNQGSGTVTSISTADNTVLATIPVGTGPAWAVASPDSTRLYVVNGGSGTVSVIDTTKDALATSTTNSNTGTVTVGTSPNYAVFDVKNQRVIVTNTASDSISVINADPNSPQYLDVTNVALPVGSAPQSVTALNDGTRLYVADTATNTVSVVNGLSLTVSKNIPVGTKPVWIASDQESTRVFVANHDSQDVSAISTLTDSELTDTNGNVFRLPAPNVDPTCAGSTCARQSPVFVAVSPG